MDPLIGYVSDENYLALCGVVAEFERADQTVAVVHSTPRGAIHAQLAAGEYRVTLAKHGYGSKTMSVMIAAHKPLHFRMLSDAMYGYAWPKWVRAGERAEYRVHAPGSYHLTLWRYGWKKEQVRAIGWLDEHGPLSNLRILPDGDFTTTGVDWNRHGYNREALSISAPEKSGLYYFHAETPSGGFLSFPWVVAPKQPAARIAVLASTNTWNAYNNFGGRSNYINADRLPEKPTVNARLDLGRFNGQIRSVWQFANEQYAPLSFDRPEPFNHIPRSVQPTDPIRGRQACHLAEAEWRLLAWLEREGFEYDFYSDRQLDEGVLDLDAYQVLIISTHPEYWSRRQFERVREWVFARGGKLMYLGGNGIDCEIEYPTETAMRCKNWLPAPPGVAFNDPATGEARDCRMHFTTGISPAALLGVVFTEAGAATSAPYQVLAADHWIFSETRLNNGDLFGMHSLHERCPGGASGHETDKITAYSPRGLRTLARGTNVNNGGAEIVYHETGKGGAVFSVGSITWTASVLVDQACSQITRNVLNHLLAEERK
ncbi:MAG TPA: N,N-dimethylformamidase beta subunit family domain-containing protein [Tepidisphaeraceae bacterium]|jgi:hypothetical protein